VVFHLLKREQHVFDALIQKLDEVRHFFLADLVLLGRDYRGKLLVVLLVVPDEFDEILDALVFDQEAWLVNVSVEVRAEKHVDFIDEKDFDHLLVYLFHLNWLTCRDDLLSDLSYRASFIDDCFTHLLHGTVMNLVDHTQVLEETFEILIISFAQVFRIAGAIAVGSQQGKSCGGNRQNHGLSLASQHLDQVISQFGLLLEISHPQHSHDRDHLGSVRRPEEVFLARIYVRFLLFEVALG
jgi:hypothetical protein